MAKFDRIGVAVVLLVFVGASPGANAFAEKRPRAEGLSLRQAAPASSASAESGVPSIQRAQQAIIRLEHRWLNNEYNPAALNEILADDFVHVVPEGMISKQEHIAFVRTHAQPHLAEHKFNKLEVRVYGNVAIANGIVAAAPAGGGAPQKTLFTDVFAFRKGRWQAVNAQETPELGKK
ncbi:MAG TPA: nuclear transport factor 2 family protein [Candidatus Acidoferrales bacterium]|nr:nuclear transport factor 2 family protein [Candidatus Acidoferrales bacterium]